MWAPCTFPTWLKGNGNDCFALKMGSGVIATDASDYIFASSWLEKRKTVGLSGLVNASVNSTCAQHPPVLLRGICLPCQSRGWGNCKFCTARKPGICQPPGHSRAFDTHAVSYKNITTQKVLLEKKQIGSSVNDRRFSKAMLSNLWMHVFIAYISRQNNIAKLGTYRRESTFFG